MPKASKLSPYQDQIRAWRAQSWTYPQIAEAMEKRHGVKVFRSTVRAFCKFRNIERGDLRFYPRPSEIEQPLPPQKEPEKSPQKSEEEPDELKLSASDRIGLRIKKEAADKDTKSKKGYTREEMDEMLATERERKRKLMRGE